MKQEHNHLYGRRRSYLDWLRVLAVLGVFFAHSIDMLDLVNWRIKYQEQSVGIMILTNFASQWGMSLMFLLAGTAAWFSLGSRTSSQFLHERITRLLIPSLFGVLLLSPVEAYFEALRHSLYQGPFFSFVPRFFVSVHIGWNLRWLAAFGYHLWFLVFLFLISVLLLPLLVLLRQGSGLRFMRWLADICTPPGRLLLLAVPFVLIQVMLQAPFPGYQNWADCFSWLISFLYGYLLASNVRFEQAITSQWRVSLLTGSTCLLLMIALYATGDVERWETGPAYAPGYVLYQILYGLTTWALLASVLFGALRYLDFSNRLLRYANEAALPFYILHYPIVVLAAFAVDRWRSPVAFRFLLISIFSLVLTLLLYDLLIRRIRVLRWLFGMKITPTEK